MIEQTLVIIKPDGLLRSLTGNIITALTETRLKIVGAKIVKVSDELAKEHYKEQIGKPFFNELVQYIRGQLHNQPRVLAMVYQGEGAIKKVRDILGSTNPENADTDTIRARYGRVRTSGLWENVVHASDSPQTAEREIKLWFKPNELAETIYPSKEVSQITKVYLWD